MSYEYDQYLQQHRNNLYTEHFIEYGYFIGLREPLGSIAEVLKNADLKGENYDKN